MSRSAARSRFVAHSLFMGALSEACDAGERIPCVGEPETWTSDHAELQEAAIHGCGVCDQFTACKRYVTAFPEPSGVWAGMTPKQQLAANRKETTS